MRPFLSLLLLVFSLPAQAGWGQPSIDAIVLQGVIESGLRVSLDLQYATTRPFCWELKSPFSLPVKANQKRNFIPVVHDGGRYELRIPLHREGNWLSRQYEKLCRFVPDSAVITVKHADAKGVSVVHTIQVAFPASYPSTLASLGGSSRQPGPRTLYSDFSALSCLETDRFETRCTPRIANATPAESATSSVGVPPKAFENGSTVTWHLDFLTEH